MAKKKGVSFVTEFVPCSNRSPPVTRICDNAVRSIGDYAGRTGSREKTAATESVKRRLRPWMLLCWPKVEGWRIEGLGRWVSLASELAGALTRTNSHAARQESPGLIHRASPHHHLRHLPLSLFLTFAPSFFLRLLTRPRPPRSCIVHASVPHRVAAHTGSHLCFLFFFFLLSLSLFSLLFLLSFVSFFRSFPLPSLRLTLVYFLIASRIRLGVIRRARGYVDVHVWSG